MNHKDEMQNLLSIMDNVLVQVDKTKVDTYRVSKNSDGLINHGLIDVLMQLEQDGLEIIMDDDDQGATVIVSPNAHGSTATVLRDLTTSVARR
jgi:hypothetical protein